MENDLLKRIHEEHKELLSLPQTLAEVLRIIRDERSDADELASVLTRDPALTTKILRIVNSAFYGVGRQISSVKQAVMTLGMRQITALTLSSSVYNLTQQWNSSINRVRFWRHSLEVAIASRMIADLIGYKQAEEAFVAGLLHDIGLLVLEHSFPEEFARVWREAGWSGNLVDVEEEVWCTNHARVAQFLFDQWRLPESICQAVGAHHMVFVRGTDEPELILCQIVCLANRISSFSICDHAKQDARIDRENQEVLRENLRISRDQLHNLEKPLFGQTVAEAKYLEIDIGSTDDILQEANQLLFEQYVTVESLLKENRQMQQQIVRDQIRNVSASSLRSAAGIISMHLEDIVEKIWHQLHETWKSTEEVTASDDLNSETGHEAALRLGLEAIRSIAKELKTVSSDESGSISDDSVLADMEARIKRQLERLDEVPTVT